MDGIKVCKNDTKDHEKLNKTTLSVEWKDLFAEKYITILKKTIKKNLKFQEIGRNCIQ